MVKLAARDQVLLEIPYYVEQSLVEAKPKRVKVGETFTVQIKGGGWTELDNTVAATYDNAAIGYACAFNSNGDVTINLVATGHPGTHLIDIYPAIYKGKDTRAVELSDALSDLCPRLPCPGPRISIACLSPSD